MKKPEWIEIFSIITNNEPQNYQENNNGIWIILNKLQKETVIKLHKFVNYCIKTKNKLDNEKIKISRIKDSVSSSKFKNNEDILKESQLLKDVPDEHGPSGFTNSYEGVSSLTGDGESNLKKHIEIEDKLTKNEFHDLLSQRMQMREREDESFLVQ